MSIPAAAHVVAWVVLGGGVAAVLVGQADVRSRLDQVEKAARDAPAAPAAMAEPPAPVPDPEVLVLKGRVDVAAKQAAEVDDVKKEVQRLWAEWLKSPDPNAVQAERLSKDPKFEDSVRDVIDRYVMERKFRDQLQKATAPLVPKKPTFDQLAKALDLKPAQSDRFAGDVRQMQQELLETLSIPRPDGVAPLEEIQQSEQYPEGSPKRAEAFLKLFKLTIPGTQETYIEHAIGLVTRTKEAAKAYLDPGQYDTLASLDIDWFGIKMQ